MAGCFFSVNTDEAQRPEFHKVFQLVSFKQGTSLVRTFRPNKKWQCKVGILELEHWARRADGPSWQLDVFEMQDPTNVELTSLIGTVDSRSQVFHWREVPCDVAGCFSLTFPQRVEARVQLNTRTTLVLCIIDALLSAGYAFVDRHVEHSPGAAYLEIMDGRQKHQKRHYLQAVFGTAIVVGQMGWQHFRAATLASFIRHCCTIS